MFDLENSIQDWLYAFRKHRAFDPGLLQEMELHLRDHIDDLKSEGLDDKTAFEQAVAEFGNIPGMAEEEYTNQQRKRTIKSMINRAMLKNYYFVTIRNFVRNRSYFLINLFGLAVGIASFTFISLYVINEINYDKFHAEYEKIFRVNTKSITKGHSAANDRAVTNAPLAGVLHDMYPEVIKATRIAQSDPLIIAKEDGKIVEDNVLLADSAFFSVFSFELLHGDPATALVDPRSIVVSESYARKYFGVEHPMGKTVSVNNDSTFYTITGVLKEMPHNSHIRAGLLVSMNTSRLGKTNRWIGGEVHTYITLNDPAKALELETKIQEVMQKYVGAEIEYYTGDSWETWRSRGNNAEYYLQSLQDIHLKSTSTDELQPTGNISYIYIYALIAVIILTTAIFNFINLATAHSSSRGKEVGVRKVIGSTRHNLLQQFMFESVLISVLATFGAMALIYVCSPMFYELVDKELAYTLTSHAWVFWGLLLLGIFVGFLGGIYPAFVLASFRPIDVMKGTLKSGVKTEWLRRFLVTMQFVACIIIIIVTSAIYYQLDYMLTKNLGFDKEQMLVLEKHGAFDTQNLEPLRHELLKNPNIKAVANALTIPGKPYQIRSYSKWDESKDDRTFVFLNNQVAYDYDKLMGLELVAGRFFSRKHRSDSNAVVINETAAKAFNFEEPVGEFLGSVWKDGRPLPIIGVVKDYHIKSLHDEVQAITLELNPTIQKGYFGVRMSGGKNVRETLAYVEETWKKQAHESPFKYFFFDADYQRLYKSEAATGKLLLVFASISICIACIGLIGLITYTASRRRKEIGIRKVLGAEFGTLIRLLSSDIIKLMALATLVAWPMAYWLTEYWLQNFVDRVVINPLIYVGSTVALAMIVGGAISFQTVRTALANPVDALKDE